MVVVVAVHVPPRISSRCVDRKETGFCTSQTHTHTHTYTHRDADIKSENQLLALTAAEKTHTKFPLTHTTQPTFSLSYPHTPPKEKNPSRMKKRRLCAGQEEEEEEEESYVYVCA